MTEKTKEMAHQFTVGELIEELEDHPDEMAVSIHIAGETAYAADASEWLCGVVIQP